MLEERFHRGMWALRQALELGSLMTMASMRRMATGYIAKPHQKQLRAPSKRHI
jgi:hypothetical protein